MRCLATLAILVLATGAWSQGPLPGAGLRGKAKPHQSGGGKGVSQVLDSSPTRLRPNAPLDQANTQSPKQNTFDQTPTDWWGRLTNVLLALVGVGQLLLLKRTNDLTKQAADAATASVELAKTSLLAGERPWVAFLKPSLVQVSPTAEGAETMTVEVVGKNGGRSPAILKSLEARVYYAALPKADLVRNTLAIKPLVGVVSPGELCGISPIPFNLWSGQEQKIFLVARVVYEDPLHGAHESACAWLFDKSLGFLDFYDPDLNRYT